MGITDGRLLGISELDETSIRSLLDAASKVRSANPPSLLKGKNIVFLFSENSTRTRAAFEFAAKNLGANVSIFSSATSSAKKGETLLDTARTYLAVGADGFIVRDSSPGSPKFLSEKLEVPIINAGDGENEHPTQALLDAFTMQTKIGDLKGKKVCIVGDIAHSRVARSNVRLLKKLGAEVFLSGPPHLVPQAFESWGAKRVVKIDDVLPELDVIMTLRVQFERHQNKEIPSIGEYRKFWALTRARAKKLKPQALIMHPGPMNRGLEIDDDVADSSQSVIFEQNTFGVWMRMAILADAFCPEEFQKWLKETPKNV